MRAQPAQGGVGFLLDQRAGVRLQDGQRLPLLAPTVVIVLCAPNADWWAAGNPAAPGSSDTYPTGAAPCGRPPGPWAMDMPGPCGPAGLARYITCPTGCAGAAAVNELPTPGATALVWPDGGGPKALETAGAPCAAGAGDAG